jgi:hypothetical protein
VIDFSLLSRVRVMRWSLVLWMGWSDRGFASCEVIREREESSTGHGNQRGPLIVRFPQPSEPWHFHTVYSFHCGFLAYNSQTGAGRSGRQKQD